MPFDCQKEIMKAKIKDAVVELCTCGPVLERTTYRHTVPTAKCAVCQGTRADLIDACVRQVLRIHIGTPSLTVKNETLLEKLREDVRRLKALAPASFVREALLEAIEHGRELKDVEAVIQEESLDTDDLEA